MPSEISRKSFLQFAAPSTFVDAVRLAADREMTTMSEYVRRATLDKLRFDGIDPTSPGATAP